MILVGGGVGIPPLYHWAATALKAKRVKKEDVTVFLGARTKDYLLCEADFKKLGVELILTTNDGTKGKKGLVTEPLEALLKTLRTPNSSLRTIIYTCGPTPMMKAVAEISQKYSVPCEVSVEVPMACGFGACLGCAIKVKGQDAGDFRFAIACTEGPVFKGSELAWE